MAWYGPQNPGFFIKKGKKDRPQIPKKTDSRFLTN